MPGKTFGAARAAWRLFGCASLALFALGACGDSRAPTPDGEGEVGVLHAALTKGTPGARIGDTDYCGSAQASLCGLGEGDCDSSAQCQPGLVCVTGNLAKRGALAGDACAPSHCGNGLKDSDETSIDCGGSCGSDCAIACDQPNGSPAHCSTDCPCSAGEGDCDSAAECQPGLICGTSNGPAFGLPVGTDACWGSFCQNGVKDGDETAVDCGGSCVPCAPPAAGAVAVAASGVPLLHIVIAPHSAPLDGQISTIANDLKDKLNAIVGTTAFQVDPPTNVPSGISLGIDGDFPNTGWPYQGYFRPNDVLVGGVLRPERLALKEQYVLRTPQGSSRVIVAGATVDALQAAVWDLLKRVGYRHYFQTPTWEVIPSQPSLSLNLAVDEKPAFVTRLLTLPGNAWEPAFTAISNPQWSAWLKHNRMGGNGGLTAGAAYGAVANYWEAHHGGTFPAALSTDPSKNSGNRQFCLTGVASVLGVQWTVESAVHEWAAAQTTATTLSLSPSVGTTWTSATKADGSLNCNDINDPTYSNVANRIAAVLNAAADAQPTKPVTASLQYDFTDPPTLALRQNVFVSIHGTYTMPTTFALENRLKNWSDPAFEVGVDDYFGATTSDETPGQVQLSTQGMVDRVSRFYKLGARRYTADVQWGWGMSGPAWWALAQALWDADAPLSAADYRNDFLTNAFGPAAPAMDKFYSVLEGRALWSENLVGTLYRSLQQGFSLTSDPAIQGRLGDLAVYTRYLELNRKLWNRCSSATSGSEQQEFKDLEQFAYATRDRRILESRDAMAVTDGGLGCPVAACAPGESPSVCSPSFVTCASAGCVDSHGHQTGAACVMTGWGVDCPTATPTSACGTCSGTYPVGSSCNALKNGVAPSLSDLQAIVNSGVTNNSVLPAGVTRDFSRDLVPYTPPTQTNPPLPARLTSIYTIQPYYLYLQRPVSVGPLGAHLLKYSAGEIIEGQLSLASNPNVALANRIFAGTGTVTDWTFDLSSNALYRLDLDDRAQRLFTDLPDGTRVAIPMGPTDPPLPLNYRWSGYIMVPAGTPSVAGWSQADGQFFRYHRVGSTWQTIPGYLSDFAVGHACTSPRVIIDITPYGSLNDHFVIPVNPPATEDEIWLFNDGSSGTVGDRVLLSTPPYLIRAPGEMLVPREVAGEATSPVSCSSAAPCPAGQYCSQAGFCRSEGTACTANNQCASGQSCQSGSCSCASASGCSASCTCNIGGGCHADADCQPGLNCVAGSCQSCAQVGCQGAACINDGECAPGLACSGGACVAFCDAYPSTPQCVQTRCSNGVHDAVCATKVCGDPREDRCGGSCGGRCGAQQTGCNDDADCPDGFACILGGAPRVGAPAGGNVCLPRQCLSPNVQAQDCGTLASTCGLCPPLRGDLCADRECGRDPSYGTVCGPLDVPCVQGKIVPPLHATELNIRTAERAGSAARSIEPLAFDEEATNASPGAVVGSFSVDERGSANYTIPIVVPPGRAGMTPSIALHYSSKSGNGIAGVGWTISGQSAITRCAKTSGTDGWALPIQFDATDAVCLDGQRLILIPGSPPSLTAGAKYRTEIDSMDKIVVMDGGSLGLFFRRYGKDGRISDYGNSTDSRMVREPSAYFPGLVVKTWALSGISDRIGNTINFEYGKFDNAEARTPTTSAQDTAEYFLISITYGGVTSPRGNWPNNRGVSFEYNADNQPRADYMEGFTASGSRIARTKQLKAIRTFVRQEQVESYELGYEQDPTAPGQPAGAEPSARTGLPEVARDALSEKPTGPNRLQSVTECSDKNGVHVCMRPTQFTYDDQRGLFANFQVIPFVSAGGTGPLIRLDFNGDGRDDFLTTDHLGGLVLSEHWVVMLSFGDFANPSFREIDLGLLLTPDAGSEAAPCFSSESIVDINGDGRDEIFDLCRDPRTIQGVRRTAYRYYNFAGDISSPGYSFGDIPVDAESSDVINLIGHVDPPAVFVDVDGDGLRDLFECVSIGRRPGGSSHFYRARPDGTFDSAPSGVVAEADQVAQCFPGSLGLLDDFTSINTPASPLIVEDVTGDGQRDVLMWRPHSDDLDGESLVDLSGWYRYVAYSGGQGGWTPVTTIGFNDQVAKTGAYKFIDVNGDGLPDLTYLSNGLQLLLNTGGNFLAAGRFPATSNNPALLARITPYSIRNSFALDYDGDGAEDLLRLIEPSAGDPAGAGSHWLWDRTNANATQNDSLTLDTAALNLSDPSREFLTVQPGVAPLLINNERRPQFALADVNGDSSSDLVQLRSDGKVTVTYGSFGHENLLTKVVDGLGKRIDVHYDDNSEFTDASQGLTYTPTTPCTQSDGAFHTRCINHMNGLVSRYVVSSDNAGGGDPDVSYRYRYADARQGLFGRGWLGFGNTTIERSMAANQDTRIELTEIDRDNSTYVAAGNLYPFAGLEVGRLTSSAVAQSPAEAQAASSHVRAGRQWELASSAQGGQFPFVSEAIVLSYETFATGASGIRATDTKVTNIDQYANVRDSTVTITSAGAPVATRTFHREYDDSASRVDAWLIALKTSETVEETIFGTPSDHPTEERTTSWSYDDLGLPSGQVREPGAALDSSLYRNTLITRTNDPYLNVRNVTVTGNWRDGSTTVAGSRSTSFQYDEEGIATRRAIHHVGLNCPVDLALTDTQDAGFGASCNIEDVRYDPRDGSLLGSVDAAGVGKRCAYDAFGRLRETSDAVSTVSVDYLDATHSFDLFTVGLVPSQIEVAVINHTTGAESHQFLDALGRVVQTETTGLDGQPVFQEYSYLWGDVVRQVSRPHLEDDSTQGYITNDYDQRWRLATRTNADHTTTTFLYGTAGNLVPTYAASTTEQNFSGTIDPKLHLNGRFTDFRGRTLRSVDGNAFSTHYVYDAFGTLGRITDAHGNVTNIETDTLGRVIEHSDGDTGVQDYQYTAFDDVFTHDDGIGTAGSRKSTLSYDALGRQTTEVSSVDGTTSLVYDVGPNAMGRLVQMISPTGETESYAFEAPPASGDPMSNSARLQSVTRSIDGASFETDFTYNAQGLVDRVAYPSSAADQTFAVVYGYDSVGNLSSVTGTKPLGTGAGETSSFWNRLADYHGIALLQETFGNGAITNYGYQDKTGRLASIGTQDTSGNVLQDVAYQNYDDNGNLTSRSTTTRRPDTGALETHAETFGYDQLDRLTSFSRDGQPSIAIGYDAIGDITSKGDGVGTYNYVESGKTFRPHAVQNISRNETKVVDLVYDDFGNVKHRDGEGVPGGAQDFTYTSFNLPDHVAVGTNQLAYHYDATHKRVLTIGGDCTNSNNASCTKRIYAGDDYERSTGRDSSGPFTRHSYKVFAGGRQIAQVEREVRGTTTTETRRYLHADRLGSAQILTDATGNVADMRTFSPFGEVQAVATTDAVSRNVRSGFTAHETDLETGLVNMRGRLYDARLGRFLQADRPFAESPLWSQGLNRYSYVFNNPFGGVDPSGFDDEVSSDTIDGWDCDPSLCSRIDPSGWGLQTEDRSDVEADRLWNRIGNDDPLNGSGLSLLDVSGGGGQTAARAQDRGEQQARQQEADWEAAKAGSWNGLVGAAQQALNSINPVNQALAMLGVGGNELELLKAQPPTDSRALQQFQFAQNGMTFLGIALGGVLGGAASAEGAVVEGLQAGEGAAAAEGAGLAERAAQVHGALDPIAQAQRTTAALDSSLGRIIAGGARDLTPAQRALLGSGEIAAKLPGAHAEVTALNAARGLGATPEAMAVTRAICPACAAAIEASGGTITSPTTVIWK